MGTHTGADQPSSAGGSGAGTAARSGGCSVTLEPVDAFGEYDAAARNDVDIVRFPDSVNLSEAIRNAATVPGTARNASEATTFVAFLLTPEAQAILKDTGQPPVVPAIRKGAVPASLN